MNSKEKVAAWFFGAVAILCAVSLFIPAAYEATAQRGLPGVLGIPIWALSAGVMLISLLCVGLIVLNARRRQSGRPPI